MTERKQFPFASQRRQTGAFIAVLLLPAFSSQFWAQHPPLPPGGQPQVPIVFTGGIVNGASFASGSPVAAGSIISLFGSNLATGATAASSLPLPTSLGGTTVSIDGTLAPLYFVSPGQINFQMPFEVSGQTQVSVAVSVAGVDQTSQSVQLSPQAPGIFSVSSSGSGQGAIQIANTVTFAAPSGSITGAQAQPANRGQIITIYCTGLGDVTNQPASGAPASADPNSLATTTTIPTLMIGGIPAKVEFAGLAPGFVGLYQVNASVPSQAPAGEAVPVVLSFGSVSSNTVTIAVADNSQPSILLSATSLTFNAIETGNNPASQTVTVSNSGGGTLSWTAQASTISGGNWLSVSPNSGTNSGALTVSVNIAGLAASNYQGAIQLAAAGAGNTPLSIAVQLILLRAAPAIAVNPASLSFTATRNGIAPAPQTISVSNSRSGTLAWAATATTSSGGNWLSVSPASGTNSGTLTVSVNRAGLAVGTYGGTITVAAQGALNTPQAIAVTLTVTLGGSIGKFAYVTDGNSNYVSAYAINPTTGALTAVPGSPFATGGGPVSVTVDPLDQFAYVANFNSNDVSVYTINATTGALTPVAGSPVAARLHPHWVTVDPLGKFVYVANELSNNLSAYAINRTTGALVELRSSPFLMETNPFSVAVDPTGKFVYVANGGSNSVTGYAIDPTTGALTAVPGTSFTTGGIPFSVTVDPLGKFAYVANANSNNVSVYTVDASTGVLTPVAGSPFVAGREPNSVTVDPSGQFAYVVNYLSSNISAYAINPKTGALTPVAGSPFSAGGDSPTSVTTTAGLGTLP